MNTIRLIHTTALLCLFTLAAGRLAAENLPVQNADFESQNEGWTAWEPEAPMSSIVAEAARNGSKYGLRVTDNDTIRGSKIQTRKILVRPGATHRVSFWSRVQSEREFIAVYAIFQTAEGKAVTLADESAYSTTVKSGSGEWAQQSFDFKPPAEAKTVVVCVHSWSSATGTADFDDFSVEVLSD